MHGLPKKHWCLASVLGFTAVSSMIIAWSIQVSEREVKQLGFTLENLKEKIQRLDAYECDLTEANRKIAEENANVAWQNHDAALRAINSRFKRAPSISGKSPAQTLNHCSNRLMVMREKLSQAGVNCAEKARDFTLGSVVTEEKLPSPEEARCHVRNLYILDEIVTVLADSEVRELEDITRGSMRPIRLNGTCRYISFHITVSGAYPSLRKLFNGLQDAKYLFIIRNIEFNAQDMVPTQEKLVETDNTKSTRIAFNKLAQVTARIDFDYVELIGHRRRE